MRFDQSPISLLVMEAGELLHLVRRPVLLNSNDIATGIRDDETVVNTTNRY